MPSVIQSGSGAKFIFFLQFFQIESLMEFPFSEDNLNSNRNDKKIDVMPVSDDSTSLDGLLWKDNIGYLPDSDLKVWKIILK